MNNKNNHSKLMWLMMVPCGLLVLILLFQSKSAIDWSLLLFLGVCIGGHFLMMRGMHNTDKNNHHVHGTDKSDDTEKKDCCGDKNKKK